MNRTTINFRKFSNENIFERREKELKMKKRSYTFRNLNKTSGYFFPKKNKKNSKFVDFSQLSDSTTNLLRDITTHHSLRQNLWNKILMNIFPEKNKIKQTNINYNLKQKHNFNKTSIGFNKSDLFITDDTRINDATLNSTFNRINNSLIKLNSKRKFKDALNIQENTKEDIYEKLMNKTKNNSFRYSINSINKNSLDILKFFQNQKRLNHKKEFYINNYYFQNKNKSFGLNKSKPEKYFDKLIDLKTKNIIVKKDSTNDFMNKLKELKQLDYETKTNEEKRVYYIENYKNDVNYFEDYSRNLQNNKSLLDKKFVGKLADYMRFIYLKTEEEKERETFMINQIVSLKEEIKLLNYKIKRKTFEKIDYLRWIYFQIKVKERILSIPNYYKEIIENKMKEPKKEDFPSKSRMSFKLDKNKKFNLDSFTSRKSFKIKRMMNQSMKDLNSYKNSEKKTDKGNIISEEEILRIKHYLRFPIFSGLEELKDHLDVFKDEIMYKSKEFYDLKLLIYNQKNWLLKYKNELVKEKNSYEQIIKLKGMELSEIKETNNNIKSTKFVINQNKKDDSFLSDLLKEKNKRIKYDKYPIFIKINTIFETCNEFKINSKQNIILHQIKRDTHPALEEMLNKLKFITQIVDNILLEFRYYTNNDKQKKELIKKMKSDIDRKHKDAKNLEQKIREKQKSIKLINKIEERNNKVLFLSYRKVDNYSTLTKKKKNKSFKTKRTSFFNINF